MMENIEEINRKLNIKNDIIFNMEIKISEMEQAVCFFDCSWNFVKNNYFILIKALNSFPHVKLYIYDIDNELFKKLNIRSNGWGEALFIKNGKIIAELTKEYTIEDCIDILKIIS